MADRFKLARASDLQADLAVSGDASRIKKTNKARKAALKQVVANMTMNNIEMLTLFPEIIQCMTLNDTEIKRMCFLFLETYAKARPQQALDALAVLVREFANPSSIVRALALRTLSSVPSAQYIKETIKQSKKALHDQDSYMRKTAAFAVAKAWSADHRAVEEAGLLTELNRLLVSDSSPLVVSSAVEALNDITSHASNLQFVVDRNTALTLARILPECTEWAKAAVLTALGHFVPQTSEEAREMANLVAPQAQHSNSAVVLGVVRLVLYLSNYSTEIDLRKLLIGPLISQLQRPPEIQYVVLRSILLLAQEWPGIFTDSLKQFFCSVNDPEYIKLVKVQIMATLATRENYSTVISELQHTAQATSSSTLSVDNERISRRAISSLRRVAIRLEESSGECLDVFKRLLRSHIQAVVQESVVAICHILRRYPDWESSSIIRAVWQVDLNVLRGTEDSSCAIAWLIGYAPDEAPDPSGILSGLIDEWSRLSLNMQLATLTAATRFFVAKQHHAASVVPRIYETVVEYTSDPDLRDRAMMYWRMLDGGGVNAIQDIVMANPSPSNGDHPLIDATTLEELELSLGYLSAVYLKSAVELFRIAKPPTLPQSPALLPRSLTPQMSGMHVSSPRRAITPRNALFPMGSRPRSEKRGPPSRLQRSSSTFNNATSMLYAQNTAASGPDSPSLPENINEEDERLIDI